MTSNAKRGNSGKFIAADQAGVLPADRPRVEAALPRTLTELLELQYDVITRAQAVKYGITEDQMRNRLRPGGSWQKTLPGVYSTLTGKVSQDQLQMAALLYAGPSASGRA